jgi:hypothetical protein
MKRILFITGMAIACLFYSCSKKDTPPNPNKGPEEATLAITDFSPKTGKPTTTITITGKGFGNDPSVVQVAIGLSPYDPPVSITPTTLTIQTNLATPSGKISVIVKGQKIFSSDDFTALPPDLHVTGYNDSGQLGEELYISGEGFGTDTNKISVSFGGTTAVKANYIAATGFYIGVYVPRYAQEGKITVTVNGKSFICNQIFTFNTSIRDYSPKTFRVGDTVKITGVKFTNIMDMSVGFNNKTTKPINVTPTEMLVIVPYGAQSGNLGISTLGGVGDIAPDKFTVLP